MEGETMSDIWKDCIEWDSYRTKAGYAVITNGGPGKGNRGSRGKRMYVHRLTWIEHVGPIPQGMHVLHKCDNPSCVNIEHLFLGTHRDNMIDMTVKRRNSKLRLLPEQVRDIRKRLAAGEGFASIGRRYNVTRQLVFRINQRLAWAHFE